MKKLRGDRTRGMPVTIQHIIFCLPACCPKMYSLKYVELYTMFVSNYSRKLVLTLLHVLASYCRHRQGAIILQRHKQRLVCWQMVNIYIFALYSSYIMLMCI
jgi:hypothetical protein